MNFKYLLSLLCITPLLFLASIFSTPEPIGNKKEIKIEATQDEKSVCKKITILPMQIYTNIVQFTQRLDLENFQENLSQQLEKYPYK